MGLKGLRGSLRIVLLGATCLTASPVLAQEQSVEDRLDRLEAMVAGLIEALLCKGTAKLSPCLFSQVQARLAPFLARGLATLEGMTLTITPSGLPCARVIASLFDRFRETPQKRFSSAI